eukprot:gene36105-1041_t
MAPSCAQTCCGYDCGGEEKVDHPEFILCGSVGCSAQRCCVQVMPPLSRHDAEEDDDGVLWWHVVLPV